MLTSTLVVVGHCLSLAFLANMPLGLTLTYGNVRGFTKRAVVTILQRERSAIYKWASQPALWDSGWGYFRSSFVRFISVAKPDSIYRG